MSHEVTLKQVHVLSFFFFNNTVSLVLYALNKLSINKDTLGCSLIDEGVATANKFSFDLSQTLMSAALPDVTHPFHSVN